jgi:hypothetical protein
MNKFLPRDRCDDIIVSHKDVIIDDDGWFKIPLIGASQLNKNTVYIAVEQMCLSVRAGLGFSGTERMALVCKEVVPSNDLGRNILWSYTDTGNPKIFGVPRTPKELAFYKIQFPSRFSELNFLSCAFGRSGDQNIATIVTAADINSFVFRLMFSLESNKESTTPAASKFAKHFQDDKIRIKL